MPADLATLTARLDKLKSARASGVSAIQSGDSRTQYRSMSEILAAIAAVEREIAALSGKPIARSHKLTSSKDL